MGRGDTSSADVGGLAPALPNSHAEPESYPWESLKLS